MPRRDTPAGKLLLSSLLAFLTLAACSPDNFQDLSACVENNTEQRIELCTKVIQAQHETGTALALAYGSRGEAYGQLEDFDRAIQDYSRAIGLDPSVAAL